LADHLRLPEILLTLAKLVRSLLAARGLLLLSLLLDLAPLVSLGTLLLPALHLLLPSALHLLLPLDLLLLALCLPLLLTLRLLLSLSVLPPAHLLLLSLLHLRRALLHLQAQRPQLDLPVAVTRSATAALSACRRTTAAIRITAAVRVPAALAFTLGEAGGDAESQHKGDREDRKQLAYDSASFHNSPLFEDKNLFLLVVWVASGIPQENGRKWPFFNGLWPISYILRRYRWRKLGL
jgi:hypothetical protein